jgi:hypothetical protein
MSNKKAWLAGLMRGGAKVRAVTFDGSNDYLYGSISAFSATTTALTVSLWVKFNSDAASATMIQDASGSTERTRIYREITEPTSVGNLHARTTMTPSGQAGGQTGPSEGLIANGWIHILYVLYSGNSYIYVDDVLKDGPDSFSNTPQTADDWYIGANWTGSAGQFLNADIAEVFIHNTSINPTVEANRRKFITAAKKPVFLGANGSLPLGVQPLIYLSGPASTFHINKGSGGNFTVNGGGLADAATSPSD